MSHPISSAVLYTPKGRMNQETTEETSGYMRPKRVNKRPNSIAA